MSALAVAACLLVSIVLVWLALRADRALLDRRLSSLGIARSLMDDGALLNEAEGAVTGKVNGVDVRVGFTMVQTSGSDMRDVTQIDVLLGEPSFALEIRPETPLEQTYRSRGLTTDVVLGDPAFDKAFIVEAAPAAAAAALLRDKLLRDRLRALHPVSLRPCPGGVRLEIERWLDEVPAMRRAFETVVVLAMGMESAALHGHAAPGDGSEGAGTYRGPRAHATREGDLRRQEEIAALVAIKERRRRHNRQKRILLLVAASLFLVAGYAARIFLR